MRGTHLQRGENTAGYDDQEPEVQVKELADGVGHVEREYPEEGAEGHSAQVSQLAAVL